MKTTQTIERTIYFSDLDGTLTKKSLVLEHFGHLISKGIVKDNGSYEAWKLDMKNEKLIVDCAISYQQKITGMSTNDLDIPNFIEEYINNDDNWYIETLEMLEVARDFGNSEIVIITGSADFLVQPLCEQLGFEGHATVYKRDLKTNILNGEIIPMFNEQAKDNCINSNYDLHLYDEIVGLGDTGSDYGIFKNTKHNILVEPTKETLEYLLIKGCKIDKIIK